MSRHAGAAWQCFGLCDRAHVGMPTCHRTPPIAPHFSNLRFVKPKFQLPAVPV